MNEQAVHKLYQGAAVALVEKEFPGVTGAAGRARLQVLIDQSSPD